MILNTLLQDYNDGQIRECLGMTSVFITIKTTSKKQGKIYYIILTFPTLHYLPLWITQYLFSNPILCSSFTPSLHSSVPSSHPEPLTTIAHRTIFSSLCSPIAHSTPGHYFHFSTPHFSASLDLPFLLPNYSVPTPPTPKPKSSRLRSPAPIAPIQAPPAPSIPSRTPARHTCSLTSGPAGPVRSSSRCLPGGARRRGGRG